MKNIKKNISARIDESILIVMEMIVKQTPLSKTDIIELGIIEFISKVDSNLEYEGINFKEIMIDIKYRKLRRKVSIKRTEFLSKNLFMARVNTDLWKLMTLNRKKTEIELRPMIVSYLLLRREEALQYKNNETLIKDIEALEKNLSENIDKLKSYVSDQLDNIEYYKQLTNPK